MTLEDFFTLTEMKDGIAATSRVKDLVNIMNNEKDSVLKNMNDTMRQWSTVANAIAATENRDCLDLFINLDGLRFIDRWLNDAPKLGIDEGESVVEESITVLLRAVENLRLDNQKSVSSGIWTTVKNLLGHSNSAVHEKAKALFDSWKEDSTESGVSEKKAAAAADDIQKQISEKPLESSSEERLDATKVHGGVMEMPKIGNSEKLVDCNNTSPFLKKEDVSKENIEFKTEEDPCLKVSEGNFGIIESESTNQEKEDEQRTYQNHNHISSIGDEEENDDDDSSGSDDEAEGDSSSDSDIFKPVTDTKKREVENKRSNIEEVDYGMVDPLEVALQVAIEVEREMDCREASCSSSDKTPNSPLSSNTNIQIQTIDSPCKELHTSPEFSAGSPPENDVGSTPVSKAIQEAKEEGIEEKEKGFCDFDLNEDVCSDDTDQQSVNPVSTPVSVVSASRAAAATGSPAAPLQFEGTFGFKGPTATSAFRPASPRRSNEGSNSKQRSDFLDFDLNVAEPAADLENHIPFSSVGESSVEASSRRWERLDLDLNLVSDGGDAPPLGRLLHLHSPSPSSSSSTMQPLLRNIDLNDHPSFLNHSSDHPSFFTKPYQNSNPKDESVISIMGARVEVNPTQNGRITMDPVPDLSLARTGAVLGIGSSYPYTHTPIYGYNTTGPGPTIPFTSAMYGPTGPIPYMVDSKGTHVVPQILASSHPFSQQHFFMSTAPSSSNGAGPSGHGFDLNTGGLIMEGGNRETGGLRQFLNPGQVNSQPSSSSSGKRKEPDSGWDPYPFNYKHHQSPWK